ncbi:MAG TPA: ABC transporter permease [Thermoanaerobaculia bacterium]|jgi:putative ABC transport system permease protein
MSTLFQDLRFALRTFVKSPGFTAVALATLALGIGANTAIFSVVNAVILKPLPFRKPAELVRVTSDLSKQGVEDLGLSGLELFDYRERSGVFSEISGLFPLSANITGGDRPERAEVLLTDVNYFEILGARPQLGRFFAKADYAPGIAEVAVISDGWWRRHYGADPNVLGRKLRLDDDLYTIIGVAPADFRHPGRSIETDVEVWAPSGWSASPFPATPSRTSYFLQGALGRLKPGVTPQMAQTRLAALGEELRREYANDYPARDGWTPRVHPLQEDLVGNVRPALLVLLAAVGFVLLIACANVANLLLARASGRRREISIRAALGAGRVRLVRQLLTESLALSIAAGFLGVALAAWGVDALVRLSPRTLPRLLEVGVDRRVLLFTLAASVLTGLVFGLFPALAASRGVLVEPLKESARSTGGPGGQRLRAALIVAEFALSLVLLVGAGLLVRTLWRLQRVDPGFEPKGLTMASLWLAQPNIPESGRYYDDGAQVVLYRRILDRLRAVPGLKASAAATRVPFGGRSGGRFLIEGRDSENGGAGGADFSSVSADYFRVLGIALRSGRLFTEHDDENAERVAIVSESLAKKYFPQGDAIGHRLQVPNRTGPGSRPNPPPSPWMRIVGIVGDVKTQALDLDERPTLYRPLFQAPLRGLTFVVRGDRTPQELGAAVEDEVRAIDSEVPIYAVRTLDDAMEKTVAERRFAMQLLGLFAVVALVLSAIGLYGVIAYNVAQRGREIGIRIALGARPGDVRRMLLREGARLAAFGVVLGLGGALLLTRLMSSLLYGVGPRDPITFLLVPAVLAAVALAATDVPARRASRVDPMRALRSD